LNLGFPGGEEFASFANSPLTRDDCSDQTDLFHGVADGGGKGLGLIVGRGAGVGAGLGVGLVRGVGVGLAVEVGVAVAVAVGVPVAVDVAVGVEAVGVAVGAVAVGVAVGAEAVGVGVGLHSPPVVTLTSTDVVVFVPVYPPTATAVLPTSVPAGNDRIWFNDGPFVQLSVTGS
jgi:hypothetical protein